MDEQRAVRAQHTEELTSMKLLAKLSEQRHKAGS